MSAVVTEHVVRTPRHVTFYLAAGPQDGPLLVFCHGWPELSISWRHQLACFGALGFRAIAPDMRGYGRSQVHPRHEDYAMQVVVDDMLELLASLGRDAAVWVGHDWGTPVVWSIASHHPERCQGVAGLCVPYVPDGFAPQTVVPLVDRTLYPADQYPVGQWDYQLYYQEHFDAASAAFEADPVATVKVLFRKGDSAALEKPNRLASIRREGGWFGGKGRAPDVPLDRAVLGEAELHQYASALARNGFFGPDSWYMNPERNIAYARTSVNGGRLAMPVLFLHGAYDNTCETLRSRLAEPMRAACDRLTEKIVRSGHWMAQEQPVAVNAALAGWLANDLREHWPAP
ncbi:MAG TPA: alpha/beta hydrolase [Caldimonas sp.]|nr:alpha/beta hydrolase [Caldimonas sp.]